MENSIITRTEWKEGLLDVCDFLYTEMIVFLKEENRYFGKVKSYMNNIKDALRRCCLGATQSEIDTRGRVLNQIRGAIYSEFKRLGNRRLSTADRVIVIFRKILELNYRIEPETEFRFSREMGTMKKVIDKLFDNICLKSKNDSLWKLSTVIQESSESEKWSPYTCDVLDLYHIVHPRPKTLTHDKPETLLDSKGSVIGESKEICL